MNLSSVDMPQRYLFIGPDDVIYCEAWDELGHYLLPTPYTAAYGLDRAVARMAADRPHDYVDSLAPSEYGAVTALLAGIAAGELDAFDLPTD